MLSDKYRRILHREAELWQAEGLISPEQYQQLSERYQFNTLETVARDRFITILLGLGCILIGLGVITFVAANWQDLSRVVKVTLLLSLFIAVNITGFYLWRKPFGSQQRLGHGLLILGALILGANMGLMSQMFHLSHPFYELLIAWGVGVLAMAYSLRLASLSVLSIILIGCGYWNFYFVSPTAWITEFSWVSLMVQHMPLLASLIFIPLAYWCRSGWIFALAAIAVISALEVNVLLLYPKLLGISEAIALTLPTALLWGYRLPWYSNQGLFQAIARYFAIVYLSGLFYFLSFDFFWQSLSSASSVNSARLNWFLLFDVLILSLLAIVAWLYLIWLASKRRLEPTEKLTTLTLGVFLCITALIAFWHLNIEPITVLATYIFNALLFLMAIGLIRTGLAQGKRSAFWAGMVLLTVRILHWFVLSPIALLFKSFIFILCGFGVIAIGIWFERYVRSLSYTSATRTIS